MQRFLIDSFDCELLMLFHEEQGLEKMALALNKDPSVVSRQLKSLAERTGTLEKVDGRWQISELGKKLLNWTMNAIVEQQSAMKGKKTLKIAATREFASRILIPHIRSLTGEKDLSVSVISSDEGIEHLLLSGKADFGFDCGRPSDPQVAYKKIAKESFVCVAAPKFIAKRKVNHFNDLKIEDCLKFSRTETSLLDLDINSGWYFGVFSDIAGQREAAIRGFGWAVIPYYAVEKEIKINELHVIPGKTFEEENYGVWWPRINIKNDTKELVEHAQSWLKSLQHILIYKG